MLARPAPPGRCAMSHTRAAELGKLSQLAGFRGAAFDAHATIPIL